MVTDAKLAPMIVPVDAPPPTRSLHRKLAQIMFEAERIPKRGKAPAVMGGYPFVQVGDAADYIRKALAEHVISMLPTKLTITGQTEHETKAGGSLTIVDIIVEWTLTDGESGESVTIESFGAGGDSGDKYSGKAQTNAMKYALLMGFLLSTGDDPELSDLPGRRARGATIEENGDTPNDGSLIGTVAKGKPPVDLELRETPDGPIAGFKLTQGRGGLQVLAAGNLATALHPFLAGLVDQRVSVWGSIEMVPWDRDGKPMPPYKRMALSRIKGPDFILPGFHMAAQESDGPEGDGPPPDAVEAESAPLFTEGEWAGV